MKNKKKNFFFSLSRSLRNNTNTRKKIKNKEEIMHFFEILLLFWACKRAEKKRN